MACDSEEAAKHSKSASKEVLPIVAIVVVVLAIVVAIGFRTSDALQRVYSRNEERIMVR